MAYQVDFAYQSPTIDQITIAPKTATVNAGITQQFTATAIDTYGNSWIITPDFSSKQCWCSYLGKLGLLKQSRNLHYNRTYGGKSDTATLTVVGHLPDATSISVSPKTSTIAAGTAQTYTATASDAYGNIWDVTSSTTFSIQTGAQGSWINNIYTSAKAGTWTVTGTYQTVSDTATLTVTHSDDPAQLASLSLSPASASRCCWSISELCCHCNWHLGNSWTVTGLTVFRH